jgi:hypothetical protein
MTCTQPCCIGLSAAAILGNASTIHHPGDPWDLRRCLTISPSPPMNMRHASPQWGVLVDHWRELADLLESEGDGWAPKTYARMRELLDRADPANQPTEPKEVPANAALPGR